MLKSHIRFAHVAIKKKYAQAELALQQNAFFEIVCTYG